jgi:hypothetical protein
MKQTGLRFRDRLRIELAVRRVDYALDGRVAMAKRKQIRNELRSNLIAAAQEVGAENAIKQLGDLHALANSYLELYRGRFDFKIGSYWAIGAYALLQVMEIALIIAFHAGVATSGAHSGTYSFQFWDGFGPFSGSVSANGSSFVMLMLSPAHVLLMLVAFAAGSSYHTVFARRRA